MRIGAIAYGLRCASRRDGESPRARGRASGSRWSLRGAAAIGRTGHFAAGSHMRWTVVHRILPSALSLIVSGSSIESR